MGYVTVPGRAARASRAREAEANRRHSRDFPLLNFRLDRPAERARPAVMREGGLELGLPAGEDRRVVESFDVLRAVGLYDHQFEAVAAGGGTCFAADERALPFVEPDHYVRR